MSETLPIAPPDNPRVQVMASPNGTVRIVGVTLDGEWVAEHCCKATRFTERHVRAMERTVKDEEAFRSVGEARVIQFPTRDAG